MTLITNKDWLNPVLTEQLPQSLLDRAETLPAKTAFVAGCLAPETASRLGRLLRVTESYYSNLIEGLHTEPAALERAQNLPRKQRQLLGDLAVDHMDVQHVFERALRRYPTSFKSMFSPELISAVHYELFDGASEESRCLSNGRMLEPGRLRSRPDEEVKVSSHLAPAAAAVSPMLDHLQWGFGNIQDPRRRIIAVLANHHRLAFVHPFLDGNGRVLRMITHLQMVQLGLQPHLWSLSRGLAHRRQDYYSALSKADRPREGDFDGRGQLSQKHYFGFIEFMLDVCHDQVDYMTAAFNHEKLRERVIRAYKTNERLWDAGVRPESAPAVIALLLQGSLPRAEFKVFTGLPHRGAIDELTSLIKLGVVLSPTPKSRTVEPGLPAWFAQEIFPELHTRLSN